MSRPRLNPRTPLSELHVHLGAAVTPAIMWGIAHAQGIRLPTKDFWAFRDLITVGRRRRGFEAYLDLFHWTELIQSSPIAVERSVYEVIGGAYRRNNVTALELRFNPMKRNRGGEQDLDHIIAAAVRGMDRAVLEYPQVRAGLIFCLDRGFSLALNEIIAAKAIAWQSRGVVGIDIAGPEVEGFRFADYAHIYATCRRAGLGLTVHAGETGGPGEVRDALEALEPDRIGHGVHGADDDAVLGMLRERGTVLEVCPSSNLNTGVLRSVADIRRVVRALIDHRVRFTISTDGPEMLRTYLRDEL
ncbi:MAG: adenosine deaminase family protein, partial [Candidatus Limnocylindria bacterium]